MRMMFTKNSRGMSLIELMVALGVSSIVSLTVMQLNQNSVKTLTRFETDSDLSFFLDGVLKSRLSKKDVNGLNNCMLNFSPANIANVDIANPINQVDWNLPDGTLSTNPLLVTEATDNTFRIGTRSWVVEAMTFGEFENKVLTVDQDGDGNNDTHPTQGTCYLNVFLRRAKTVSFGPRRRNVRVAFDCAKNSSLANGIESTLATCQIADKTIVERWTVEHDPGLFGTYIQYQDSPGGFVSIGQPQLTESQVFGTEAPEFPLEILSSESVWYLPVFSAAISIPFDHVYGFHNGRFGITESGDAVEGQSCLEIQEATNSGPTPYVAHCLRTSPLSAPAAAGTQRESFSRYLNRVEILKGNIFVENGNLNIGPQFVIDETNANLIEIFPSAGTRAYVYPYDMVDEKILFSAAIGSGNDVRRPYSAAVGASNQIFRRSSFAFGRSNIINTEANFNRNYASPANEPVTSTILFGHNIQGSSATTSVGHRLIGFGLHDRFDKAVNTISFNDRQFGRATSGTPHYKTVEGFTATTLPFGISSIGGLTSPYLAGTYAHATHPTTHEDLIYQSIADPSTTDSTIWTSSQWVLANGHFRMGSNISSDRNAFQTFALGDEINFEKNGVALGSFINIGGNVSDVLVIGQTGATFPFTGVNQTFNTDQVQEVPVLLGNTGTILGDNTGWTAILGDSRIRFASDADKGSNTVAGYLNVFSIDKFGNLEIGNTDHSSLSNETQRNDFSQEGVFSHQNSAAIGTLDADIDSPYSAMLFSTDTRQSGGSIASETTADQISAKGGVVVAAAYNVQLNDCLEQAMVIGGDSHIIDCFSLPTSEALRNQTIIGGSLNRLNKAGGSSILGGYNATIINNAATNQTEQDKIFNGTIVGGDSSYINRVRTSGSGTLANAYRNVILGGFLSSMTQNWDGTTKPDMSENALIATNNTSIVDSDGVVIGSCWTCRATNVDQGQFYGLNVSNIISSDAARTDFQNLVALGSSNITFNPAHVFKNIFVAGGYGLNLTSNTGSGINGSAILASGQFNASPFPRASDVTTNRFYAYFPGGVYLHLYEGSIGYARAYLNPGSSSWQLNSSKTFKESFTLDREEIFQKILNHTIERWVYKDEERKNADGDLVSTISPYAEDFYEDFGTGGDNKKIAPLDITGVAILGLQEIHKKQVSLQKELAYQKTFLGKVESFIVKIKVKVAELRQRQESKRKRIERLKRKIASLKNEANE